MNKRNRINFIKNAIQEATEFEKNLVEEMALGITTSKQDDMAYMKLPMHEYIEMREEIANLKGQLENYRNICEFYEEKE